jgi:hypothetical protein
MIMILITLYLVINTVRGGGNPTTFARMQLIPVSSSIEAVKPYHFSTLCIVSFSLNPTMYRGHGSCRKGRAQRVPNTVDI